MKLISVSVSDIYLGFEGNKSRTWRKMQRLQKIVSGIPDDARDKHFSRRLLAGGRVSQCTQGGWLDTLDIDTLFTVHIDIL